MINLKILRIMELILMLIVTPIAINAAIPMTMNYQGRLTDDQGQPETSTVSIIFTIYDSETGGNSKWTETHPSVSVVDGLFNVVLGNGIPAVPIEDTVFLSPDRWIEITVSGEVISPRTKLTSSSYAYQAIRADTAKHVDGGVGVTQLIELDGVEFINGYLHYMGTDSVNAPAPGYVMCQASMALYCDHQTGIDACINVEIRDTLAVHYLDQEYFWCLPPSLPTDFYQIPVTIHRIFPVEEGYSTFFLIGSDFHDAGDAFYANKVVMTLTYYPLSYGTVMFDDPDKVESSSSPACIPLDPHLRDDLKLRSKLTGIRGE